MDHKTQRMNFPPKLMILRLEVHHWLKRKRRPNQNPTKTMKEAKLKTKLLYISK